MAWQMGQSFKSPLAGALVGNAAFAGVLPIAAVAEPGATWIWVWVMNDCARNAASRIHTIAWKPDLLLPTVMPSIVMLLRQPARTSNLTIPAARRYPLT